jgi:hypothetical protein
MAGSSKDDLLVGESEIFSGKGLDSPNQFESTREIGFFARFQEVILQGKFPSAVDLTFASAYPRVLLANAKSQTALESIFCQCPFGSDIRKRVRCNVIRMSEPGQGLIIPMILPAEI